MVKVGVKVKKKQDKLKIEVTSSLREKTVAELYKELLDLTGHPAWGVHLDLRKVSFVDAAGLGLLLSAFNTFPVGSLNFELSTALKRLFLDLGLDEKISQFFLVKKNILEVIRRHCVRHPCLKKRVMGRSRQLH